MELKDVEFVIKAHSLTSKSLEKRFRKWDKSTPYHIHPILCACLILQEPKLPEELRKKGSLALLYHDILEDTSSSLPDWLTEEVKSLIKRLTFNSSSEKWQLIWDEDKFIKLLELYDLVSNMLDNDWMPKEKKQKYKEILIRLSDEVAKDYRNLNIVKISKSLI